MKNRLEKKVLKQAMKLSRYSSQFQKVSRTLSTGQQVCLSCSGGSFQVLLEKTLSKTLSKSTEAPGEIALAWLSV